jgi:hypothetical protein
MAGQEGQKSSESTKLLTVRRRYEFTWRDCLGQLRMLASLRLGTLGLDDVEFVSRYVNVETPAYNSTRDAQNDHPEQFYSIC